MRCFLADVIGLYADYRGGWGDRQQDGSGFTVVIDALRQSGDKHKRAQGTTSLPNNSTALIQTGSLCTRSQLSQRSAAELIRFSLAHINPAADYTILVLVIGLSIRDCVFLEVQKSCYQKRNRRIKRVC